MRLTHFPDEAAAAEELPPDEAAADDEPPLEELDAAEAEDIVSWFVVQMAVFNNGVVCSDALIVMIWIHDLGRTQV